MGNEFEMSMSEVHLGITQLLWYGWCEDNWYSYGHCYSPGYGWKNMVCQLQKNIRVSVKSQGVIFEIWKENLEVSESYLRHGSLVPFWWYFWLGGTCKYKLFWEPSR